MLLGINEHLKLMGLVAFWLGEAVFEEYKHLGGLDIYKGAELHGHKMVPGQDPCPLLKISAEKTPKSFFFAGLSR